MPNRDLEAARTYHESTKHSLLSIHNDAHHLDFPNQPLPFKIYSGLEPIPLPRDFPPSGVPALEAISHTGFPREETCIPDLATLAGLLFHSAGITKRRAFPGGEILFRAAACTGALYHIELYLVCGDLPGLEAGVYHFDAHDFALRQLRAGDYRGALVQATAREPSVEAAPGVLVCTSTYWRNSWKYRSRAYRHCFWDSGTILANLLAVASAHQVPARVVRGFADDQVNGLLGLDTQKEVALSLIPLGYAPEAIPGTAPHAPPLDLDTVPLSRTEVEYPAIGAMHAASALSTPEEAAAWRGPGRSARMLGPSGGVFPLEPPADGGLPRDSVQQVALRRGSSRQFARRPITLAQLSTILSTATQGVPADFLEPVGAALNDLYLIVNDVEGLPGGSYVFHPSSPSEPSGALELLEEGAFRRASAYLGLQQALPGDASVNVFFLADLEAALDRLGNRGYGCAQLEAGIVGGKLYLGAYAQKLGATGLTFFDDDVTTFFSPHAEGKSVMFLVALGVPARRPRPRE